MAAREPDITPTQFASYLDSYPATLRCWESGRDSLFPLLGWVNTKAVVDLRGAFTEMGPVGVRLSPVLHNQAGTAVSWAVSHLRSSARAHPPDRSRRLIWELARRYWIAKNLLVEVRQGSRGFEVADGTIRMAFFGDAGIDALDRLLDVLADVRSLDVSRPATTARVRAWLDAGGRDVAWTHTPAFVHDHFRTWATALMDLYPRYLPEGLDAGGFTMRQAAAVLTELLARAQHSQSCLMRYSTSVQATLPFFLLDDLVDDLSRETGVGSASVSRLVATLTLDLERCPDPCLTPIVPVGQALVPMSCLIAPGSPMRNLTSLLQLDPARFGAAGTALGRLGVDSCVETLERVSGARLAKNVRLVSPGGVRVGDLDVVLVDPSRRLMVVFEVTWQIGPDGAFEIGRALQKAADKRDQVAGNRAHLAQATAMARWPVGWPDVTGYATRWYVLTRDVLPLDPPRDGIVIRSHQMLAWMLRLGASLGDLIGLLDNPPAPPVELAEMHQGQTKFGAYRIEWTQVAV